MDIRIRNGFVKAKDGVWYNVERLSHFEVEEFDGCFVILAVDAVSNNVIAEFKDKIAAQKALDDLMENATR